MMTWSSFGHYLSCLELRSDEICQSYSVIPADNCEVSDGFADLAHESHRTTSDGGELQQSEEHQAEKKLRGGLHVPFYI